jgi:hypothetical protein
LTGENVLTARRARAYVAILMIYERLDLVTRFIDLLKKGDSVLSQSEIARLVTIVEWRKAILDRRFRLVSLLGRGFSHYAGENFGLHLTY